MKEKIHLKNMLEVMQKCNPNHSNLVMTVIDDKGLGEKALISNHKLVCTSMEGSFFNHNVSKIVEIEESGLKEIAGCRIFCELIGQEKKLVICGGGHVSIPVIQMGLMIGFSVTVLEDRPKFANNARIARATEVICESFDEGLKKIEGNEDTFFIIITRGHRYDQVCLESIVKKKHAYIGMIGSKRRVVKVKEAVLENGGDSEVVNRVYTPIGMDIGAETPEEIAIAIMAEIIDVKNKRKRNSGFSKEIVRSILGEEEIDKHKVMATIVSRIGSAPREVGAKMMIFSDGSTIGTIGGGCVESEVITKGLLMIRCEEVGTQLYHVDMSGADAEEEGMVCGGMIDVLLETV